MTAIGLAGIAVLAVLFWGIFRTAAGQQEALPLPRVPGKKALAVMFFENQSANADFDLLREGLADMLITDLARYDKLTVLSRQQLHMLLERIGYKPREKTRL